MITIKNEEQSYAIKLKQRVEYSYDFDEDSMVFDMSDASEKFNEQADSIVSNKEYINNYLEEKASYVKSIDFSIDDSFATAVILLNKPMSKSDVEFYFDTFIEDVLSELSNQSVTIEGDFDYDDFDPSSAYGHISRSRHGESEGEVSISTDGKVQIEYNK